MGAARLGRALGGALLLTPFALAAAAAPESDEPPAREIIRFADTEIDESSGLVAGAGRLITVNDSGDSGRVFVVDAATGETTAVSTWQPDPVDVEALAPVDAAGGAADAVWVADIGDNLARRDTVSLLRVPVGAPGAEIDGGVEPERIELRYDDGPRDAETLLVHPQTGRMLVVSKGVLGGRFYAVPDAGEAPGAGGGVGVMRSLAPAVGIATDGAFWPDGRHLVVRTYGRAVVYDYPGLTEIGAFDLPRQRQGEAVAIDPARPGHLLLTSEGVGEPVLEVAVPAALRAQMDASGPAQDPSDGPAPTDDPGAEEPETADDPADAAPSSPSDAGRPATALLWTGGIAAAGLLALGLAVARLRRR